MFNTFSEEARKTIIWAKEEMVKLKHPYVSSEHLMLAILKGKNNVSSKLKKYNLTYDTFKKEVIKIMGEGSKISEYNLYTPMLKKILEHAMMISLNQGEDVLVEHLFEAILDEGEGIAIRIINSMKIDIDALYNEFVFKTVKKSHKRKSYLDEIGKNMVNDSINNDPVIGRENEIKRVIEILMRKSKNNPLIIGDAGVGKTAIVEELSRMIFNGDVPTSLINKRIINIDMSSLVAGTKYRGEFEDKVNKIIREVEDNDDIILFIDEIHTLVGAGGAEGAIDAANIFKPALARGKIRVIGATTTKEYKKFIENDKALERRFQIVQVDEPNNENLKNIITSLKPVYEKYHKVIIKDDTIDYLIEMTRKYIKTRKDPDRTIDILDEVCSHTNLKENKKLKDYNKYNKELSEITKLKREAILNDEYEKAFSLNDQEKEYMSKINDLELELMNLKRNEVTKKDIEDVLVSKICVPRQCFKEKINKENILKELKKEIIGQDDVLNEILKIYEEHLHDDNCLSMMFTGTSGVGKTETSLLLSKLLNYHVLRLDMSEYSEAHNISKLIGSPAGYAGYNEEGLLDKINLEPFTIILLDEVERCHEKVLNLFLQILDNNKIKNAKGDTIYFNNAIIIMTSNIRQNESIGFNESKNGLHFHFSKTLINRINKIIDFHSLKKDDIIAIIKTKYHEYKFKDEEINKIISSCDYKNYGARQIPYIIKDLNFDKKIYHKNYKKLQKKVVKN